ncbi:MAG: hypothetical protein NC416_02875 [Eubacterium sp.]|nr:hypothetical protein [Eubacterium sp.]
MRIYEDADRASLVPMHIDAMIQGGQQNVKFASMNFNYNSLKRYPSGEKLEGSEFVEQIQPDAGIYLHFILPKQFTHGVQEQEGADVSYPEIPNRFTVTRAAVLRRNGDKTELARKDWLVEGDVIKETSDDWRRTSVIGWRDEKRPYRFLGIQREYDGNITSEAKHIDSFHALTSGIPYFCGYYPECKSALGFYDELAEFDMESGEISGVRLTYFVSGWVERETDEDPVICHGLVTELIWKGKNYHYQTGMPAGEVLPNVAVGNCVEEAMAALLSFHAGKSELEKVMKHLFFGMLPKWDKLDGALEGEKQIHQYQFEGTPSKEQTGISGANVNLTWEKHKCLDNISRAGKQQQLYEEKIKEKQQQIYLFWRRYAMDVSYMETAKKEIRRLGEEIRQLELRLSHSRAVQKEQEEILRSRLEEGETLATAAGSRYWMPKDLTVVLEGADQSNLYKRLDEYEREGKDYARNTDQIISRVKIRIAEVTTPEGMVLDGSSFFGNSGRKSLPPILEKLVWEGFLIARGCICYLAENILRENGIAVEQNIFSHTVTEYESCLQKEENLDGKLPSPISIHTWKPSWNPLILEWRLRYYPDPETKGNTCSLKNWELDRNDFVYRGAPVSAESFETVQGRTVLSHHGPDYLAEMFHAYVEEETYRDLGDKLRNTRALSQCMEGLNHTLLTRRNRLIVSPWQSTELDPEIAAMAARMTTDVELYRDMNFNAVNNRAPMEAFYPIRAGKMRIDKIRVIDNFGRVLVYQPGDVILPEGLREGEKITAPYVWLKPRILAPLRIEAQWEYTRIHPDSDRVVPVCGWIWANLMDSCLHIYGSDGRAVGSIQAIFPTDRSSCRVVFRNPPGETRTEEEILTSVNSRLQGFVTGILKACGQEPTVLYEFLKLLDEGLWNMQTKGDKSSEAITFLGRPLALCTMTIQMDMKGTYPHPMFYEEKKQKSGLESMRIPLRIGDEVRQKDGTTGFYHHTKANDFSVFHTCIKSDRENDYIDNNTVLNIPLSKEAGKEEVTVLLSPYGKVTLTSGLLPVKEMRLDAKFTEQAMQNIYFSIYAGPFLTPGTGLQLLLPKAMEKEWTYVYYEKPGERMEDEHIQNPWMEAVYEEQPCKIEEGWLILKAKGEKGDADGE